MANQSNNIDFQFEHELKKRLQADAKSFDSVLSSKAREDLFTEIEQLSLQTAAPTTSAKQRNPFWLGLSLAASVGLAVLTLTLPNQHTPIEQPPLTPINLNQLVAELKPVKAITPLAQEQVLSNEYQAILSDIEKLGARLGVN